jgi:Coenzyme F420-reducing hydrogenase, beta subunit
MIDEKGLFLPEINWTKCISCGVCLNSCPGGSIDLKKLNLQLFGRDPDNNLIGNYLNFYIGHSTNHEIRYNSSSGGIVTELLIYALELGL